MGVNVVKLKDIVDVLNGYAFKSSKYVSSGYRVMRITNVQKGTLVDDDPKYYEQSNDLNRYELRVGDILISLTGNVGRVGLVEESILPAYLNQRVGCLRIKSDKVCNEYLFHWLNNDSFEDNCIRNSNGIAQLNLSTEWLKDVEIQLPSLQEQKKIAKILDKADEIRAKKKLANDKLDEFLKSTFISMFGDPIKNEKNYRIEKLQNVTKFLTDGKHGDCEDEDNSGYYFVSAKCINNGKIDLAQARQIKYDDYKEVNKRVKINVGDLLIVNTGATIGKMAIIRDEGLSNSITLQKSVAVINMDNDVLNSEYLSHCLLFKSMAKVSAGSAIHNLLLSTMRAYELPIPPIEDQNKFAKIVEHVEAQKQKNELVIEQMNNLFNSLSQRAFKGEL